MDVYKTKDFSRAAGKDKISDEGLTAAAEEIEKGRIDADLGAHLVKQRISQGPGGRSNSHRAIIATKEGERIVFLHLFAKNVRQSLTRKETEVYREAAKRLADLTSSQVEQLLQAKEWIKVENVKEQKGIPK